MMVPKLWVKALSFKEYDASKIIGGRRKKKNIFESNSKNLTAFWLELPDSENQLKLKNNVIHLISSQEKQAKQHANYDQAARFWHEFSVKSLK